MSETRDLKELLSEIDEVTVEALVDLDTIPSTTRAAHATAKRRAQEALTVLNEEYCDSVAARAVGIVVVGPPAESATFAGVVEATGDGVSVSAVELYEKLADTFYETIGNSKEYGPTQQSKFNLAWNEVLRDLGIDPRTAKDPSYAPRRLTNKQEAVELAKELAINSGGFIPNQIYVRMRAADRALAIRYKESTLPVVVTGATEDEAKIAGVFGRGWGVVRVSAGEVIGPDEVKRAFEDVARQLKKKRTK